MGYIGFHNNGEEVIPVNKNGIPEGGTGDMTGTNYSSSDTHRDKLRLPHTEETFGSWYFQQEDEFHIRECFLVIYLLVTQSARHTAVPWENKLVLK